MGSSGRYTSAIRPISGDQMPAAATTFSYARRPCAVWTACTRPWRTLDACYRGLRVGRCAPPGPGLAPGGTSARSHRQVCKVRLSLLPGSSVEAGALPVRRCAPGLPGGAVLPDVRARRPAQATDAEVVRLALCMEPLIERDATHQNLRQIPGRTKLAGQSGGVRGCAATEGALFKRNHGAPTQAGQVVGNAGAGNDNSGRRVSTDLLVSQAFTACRQCAKCGEAAFCRKRCRWRWAYSW